MIIHSRNTSMQLSRYILFSKLSSKYFFYMFYRGVKVTQIHLIMMLLLGGGGTWVAWCCAWARYATSLPPPPLWRWRSYYRSASPGTIDSKYYHMITWLWIFMTRTPDSRAAAGVGGGGGGGRTLKLKTVHLYLLSLDQPHPGQELADIFTLITLQLQYLGKMNR